MHIDIVSEEAAADRIVRRLLRESGRRVVFVRDGRQVNTLPAEDFDRIPDRMRVVGIYDARVTQAELAADIKATLKAYECA